MVLVALAVLMILLQGCAAMQEHFASVTETPARTPGKLDASVYETGILLVKAEMIGKDLFGKHSYNITAASLATASDPEQVKRVGNFADGLIVFSDLPPGDYAVVRVDGWRNTGNGMATLKMPVPLDPMHTITIEAGDAKYFGKVTCRDAREGRVGRSQWVAEWSEDGEEEALAWEELRDEYSTSMWVPTIIARMKSARGQTN